MLRLGGYRDKPMSSSVRHIENTATSVQPDGRILRISIGERLLDN